MTTDFEVTRTELPKLVKIYLAADCQKTVSIVLNNAYFVFTLLTIQTQIQPLNFDSRG